MEKKKRFSVLKLLITIICISSIIVSAAVNILFAKGKTPNIFGRYVYVVGEDNPMAGELTTGAALISMDASDITLATGDIVICYPADNPNNLVLRSISFIAEGDDGSLSYYTKDSYHDDSEGSITKDKILAVCTGYPESHELGRFITFARSLNGIIILLGVTGLILLIFIISAVARSRSSSEEDEEDFGFYEYDDEEEPAERRRNARHSDPLYEPTPEIAPNPELERKMMSIAENFKQKEVNPNSPYQKEKERTMQFKAQKNANLSSTMSFSTSGTAESNFAARNPGNISSPAPTAETLREEMLRKTAAAERTGTYNVRRPAEPISDNTGILSTAQVAELRGGAPARPEAARITAPKKSSTPDISDIIGKSSGSRRTKSPSDMSVDDLLKMIEDEKKRL